MPRKMVFVFGLVFAFSMLNFQSAAAHGETEAGDYEIEIGFHVEPAYQGEPNGLDLFVTNMKTDEKVNGLEETLKAEIIFGSSKKELTIEPQWGQDGAYTAYLIPTEVGDYTWHIFGDIEGTAVDITMTSSPDTFSSVESKASASFPIVEASSSELTSEAASASSSAQTALFVGVIGVILGLLGVVFGVLGYQAARRRSV